MAFVCFRGNTRRYVTTRYNYLAFPWSRVQTGIYLRELCIIAMRVRHLCLFFFSFFASSVLNTIEFVVLDIIIDLEHRGTWKTDISDYSVRLLSLVLANCFLVRRLLFEKREKRDLGNKLPNSLIIFACFSEKLPRSAFFEEVNSANTHVK